MSKWRCRSNHVRKNCRKSLQQILFTHLLGNWLDKICYGLLSLLFTTIYSFKFCFVKQKIDGSTTNDQVMPGDHVFLNFLGKKVKVKKWDQDFENPWDNGRTWPTWHFLKRTCPRRGTLENLSRHQAILYWLLSIKKQKKIEYENNGACATGSAKTAEKTHNRFCSLIC